MIRDFPLQGMRLIEASAGTGKTYTLAALYVRLVLGHGEQNTQPVQGLAMLPPQILVVTFTKAATEELRDRIRQRLVAAAQVFRGELAADAVLAEIVADYPPHMHQRCAAQLQLAAEWMDEAAIFTIHGWCQRMLSEHAFDAGTAFAQTMNHDLRELSLQIARDYWRYFLYPLTDSRMLAELGSIASSPEALYRSVQPWLRAEGGSLQFQAAGNDLPKGQEPGQVAHILAQWLQRVDSKSAQITSALDMAFLDTDDVEKLSSGNLGSAVAAIDAAIEAELLNKNSYKAEKWFATERPQLLLWQQHPELFDPLAKSSQEIVEKFSAEKLLARTKKGKEPPEHPLFTLFAELLELIQQRPQVRLAVLSHAAEWFAAEFTARKVQRAELGFDDLLTRLHAALHSDGGSVLAARIRAQFPMAMVDEFQDTDPIQFGIFRQVYPDVQTNEYGLVLVGDPKQAIYSFRGADLHTYLQARELTTGHHYNLPKNFRSTEALVEGVNALFSRAEQQPQGAFGFAHEQHNPLPFLPVTAAGRTGSLLEQQQATPAVNYWLVDEAASELSKGAYQQQMAEACADRIAGLLNESDSGAAGFAAAGESLLQAITPADIAILVRDRNEAAMVRQQLSARGLRSVYMSDKDSIFATEEATTMLSWLQAVYAPDNETRLRAALMLRLSGQSDAGLAAWLENEQDWEQVTDRVREFRDIWRYQGVLPMLRAWLHFFELPQHWLQGDEGERTLTNMLHLAELLQQESAHRDGETGLLRWFAQQLSEANKNEELVQRLESDAERIKVVTIHKSKGLQYSLVFLPFICSFRAVKKGQPVRFQADGRMVVELEPDDEALARADNERLQEDIRLLYVALTRPVYACWLGIAAYKEGTAKHSKIERSGLGALLGLPEKPSAADLKTALAELPWRAEARPTLAHFSGNADEFVPQQAERLAAKVLREHWWIASYSALRIGATVGGEAPDTAVHEQYQDDDELPNEAISTQPLAGIHAFARGAAAGTFLHSLLEYACETRFAETASAETKQWLERRLTLRGWQEHLDAIHGWLQEMATVQLSTSVQCLAELPKAVSEMEFWLAVNTVRAGDLDAVIRRHVWPGIARPELLDETLNGMLKGFIDLTYVDSEGRYWVCDYKSNWLGADESAYGAAAMQKAMLEKRYDVQASLYLFALHRLLSARIPDYRSRMSEYLGGAMYWFIRAPKQGQCMVQPPIELLLELDALFADNDTRHTPTQSGLQGAKNEQ
ncbi:exodeoxyribonuclease V subunit beta [Aliidiomarina sp.]|uniref:exodeoxyribonuclease V subunit beta n=1 Tax=Aliidiomarina sp. TaxID=1872439 RepID=UPI003A4DA671